MSDSYSEPGLEAGASGHTIPDSRIGAVYPRRASLLSRLAEQALGLVFPPRCVACRQFGSFLCDSCLSSMTKAEGPRCPACWMAGSSETCARCRDSRPAVKAVRSVFVYEGAARDAVLALKYEGVSALAPRMARAMAERLLEWNPPVSAVVPVPLAGLRRRLRGYNQSELLVREVSWATGLPLERRALVKRRSTPPQAGQPDEEARRQNVARAFAPGRAAGAGGVLLIDDVITTGATIDACARVLLSAGSGPVFALTFARED